MNSVTRPIVVPQPEVTDETAIKAWLDELATGDCDPAEFLQLVQERFKSEPDGSWEVLSQLDQYYRRGKIKPEVFHAVKTALAESALGAGDTTADREDQESSQAVGLRVADDPAPPRTTAPAEEPTPQTGRELKSGSVLRDRYRIESILGQGGMGTVFQAIDEYRLESEGQRIAVKVLHTAVTMRADLFVELRREFQHLQLLSHPNIVRVFEFDRDGSIAFFTMELLSGELLSRVLQARNHIPLERAQALAVIRDVGTGIAHAHSRGVIHGDINPQNIFITGSGDLRVLDFGASHKWTGRGAIELESTLACTTPGYASCQVMEGARPDVRDDVFALACVAYLLLCGRHPFSEKTAIEARADRLRPRRPANLTTRQWRALRGGLRWEREKRPADVQQWLAALDLRKAAPHLASLSELLQKPPPRRTGFLAAALVAASAALLAGGYWFASNRGLLPSFATGAPTRTAAAPPPPPAAAATTPTNGAGSQPDQPAPDREPAAQVSRQAAAIPPAKAPTAAPATAPTPGPSKIEFAADTVEVPAQETSAQITVRRRGNLRGEASFIWWTESGTAKPGVDFAPVIPQLARIEDGKSGISLSVPLNNKVRAQEKSFYVVIDQSEGGAALGSRTVTMVTLSPAN
jgi:eukaryotic-like serine/threonine-protein kinase